MTKNVTKTSKTKKATKSTKVSPRVKAAADGKYLELRIGIRNYVRKHFEDWNPDTVEEIEQSVQVFAYETILSLAKKNRLHDAFATTIAQYGIKKHMTGRPGGLPSNSTDVLGERCKYLRRVKVSNHGLCENVADTFQSEATVVDGRYPVHRTVALRIDFFETWYRQQTPKDQIIIRELAMGHTTTEVAQANGISMGRVSQLRKAYAKSWYEFISDPKDKPDLLEELKALADKEST